MKFQFCNQGNCPVVISWTKKSYNEPGAEAMTTEVDLDETVVLCSVASIESIVPEDPDDDEDDGPGPNDSDQDSDFDEDEDADEEDQRARKFELFLGEDSDLTDD